MTLNNKTIECSGFVYETRDFVVPRRAAPWIVISEPILVERISAVDEKELGRLLYPLLKVDDRPKPAEMLAATRPREEGYLVAIASGKMKIRNSLTSAVVL